MAQQQAQQQQDERSIQQDLSNIHQAYTRLAPAASQDKNAPFTTIVYTQVTPEIRHLQNLQGYGIDGRPRPYAHAKPTQVAQQEWTHALASNPDYTAYMPMALVGAQDLQARLMSHQENTLQITMQVQQIRTVQKVLHGRIADTQRALQHLSRHQQALLTRLLRIMGRVELLRCYNLPLQTEEMNCQGRLVQCQQALARMAVAQTPPPPPAGVTGMPEAAQLYRVLQEHQRELAVLLPQVRDEARKVQRWTERVEHMAAVGP